jgi:putative SOS response-associated peptidase YedK
MCNLYSLNKRRDMVARFFRISHNRAVMFEPSSAIFPKHKAPVVRLANGERELVMMSWGFTLLQKGRATRPVTNVRDDKILTSPFWKSSFEERRCLVPASSFCEPNGNVESFCDVVSTVGTVLSLSWNAWRCWSPRSPSSAVTRTQ